MLVGMQHLRTLPLAALALLALVGCSTTAAPEPTPEASGTAAQPSDAEPSGPAATLEVETVLDGVGVPRELVDLGDDRWLVSDQTGRVHVVDAGALRDAPLLDVTDRILAPSSQSPELGLAGFAVAPDFASSGTFYTLTTEPSEGARRADTLRRWQTDAAALSPASGDGEVLLQIPQTTLDHVGELAMTGDGELFIGVGAPSRSELAGDPDALQGSILRIAPTEAGYDIPASNPFADGGGLPEIHSLGYRNPFRFDWDEGLGLIVAQPMFSERAQQVSTPQAGDDAGYPETIAHRRCWEEGALHEACTVRADGRPIAPPVLEYGNEVGQIVSGAMALHGAGLEGRVLVSDWRGALLLATAGEAPWQATVLGEPEGASGTVWDLAEDSAGTVYLAIADASMRNGRLVALRGLPAG